MNEKNILILGIGNDILTDDGIGPRLASDMSKVFTRPDIIFNFASCGGLEILEYIKGYRKVIFIDAIRSVNGKPGEVYHFTPSEFRETSNISNLHDINFLTALKMGELLDIDLPSDLHIIAVEIISDLEFSEELSEELEEAYPVILEKVKTIVQNCLA
jgi:hydrogenase maturation protease